jgi:hypothetical protein
MLRKPSAVRVFFLALFRERSGNMTSTLTRSENRLVDDIVTRVHLPARPEEVWRSLMFFEDVPFGRWSVFRILLPRAVRSEGDKSTVGNVVRCVYEGGHLIKRITLVEPGRCLRFEVIEQHLGIEQVFRAYAGAYELRHAPLGTEVALTTHYGGSLRPRFLWRRVERFFGHRFHHHILLAIREALRSDSRLLTESMPVPEERSTASAPPR